MPFFAHLSSSRSSLSLLTGTVSTHTFTLIAPNQWILFIFLSICLFINLYTFPWLKLIFLSHPKVQMEPKGNSSISADLKTNKKTVAPFPTPRPSWKSTGSSSIVMKPNGKSPVSSAPSSARGDHGKSPVSSALSSACGDQVMLFRDVSLGPHEADLRFRLIHFWEARNPNSKTLIGQEMLLIDEEVRLRFIYYWSPF